MNVRFCATGLVLGFLVAGCGSGAAPAPPPAAGSPAASTSAAAKPAVASAKPASQASAPAAAAPSAQASASAAAADSGTLAQIKKRGVANTFMEAQFEPYESVDKDGKVIGLDVDLAGKMFHDDMPGVTLKITDAEYAGLLPALIDGKADFLISALGPTKERVTKFDFSMPYSPTTTVAVARQNDGSITKVDDLNGKVVGAQTGTPTLTNAQNFDKSLKEKGGKGFRELKDYPHFPAELEDLNAKRLDAVSMSLSSIALIINQRPGQFKIIGPIGPLNYFELVARKGDTGLVDYVNSEISKFKKDGTLAALHKKWFGENFPVDVSALPDTWVPLT